MIPSSRNKARLEKKREEEEVEVVCIIFLNIK
jgi:hypothetical protein